MRRIIMGQVYPVTPAANVATLGIESELASNINERIPAIPLSVVTFETAIAAGSAGADQVAAGNAFMTVPTGYRLYIKAVNIIAAGTSAGIDGSNTCLIALTNITESVNVAAKTFTNVVVYPAANVAAELTLVTAQQTVKAGDTLGMTITQGTTADHNGFVLQVIGLLEEV